MAFFYKGNTYKTWERKGLAPNKKGVLSISENSFEKGEVLPSTELTYIGKKDGMHICTLPNGTEVAVHRNHFDPTTGYNKAKIANRAKQKGGTPVQVKVDETPVASASPEAVAAAMSALQEELTAEGSEEASDEDILTQAAAS